MKTEIDRRFIEFSENLKNDGIIPTYKAFCESVSISQQVYNDIKAGRRGVTIDIIKNTCNTYNISSDYFFLGKRILETKTPKNVVNENDHINDHNFDHKRKLQKTWSNDDADFKTKTPKKATFGSDKLEIETSAGMPFVTLAKAADLVAIPVVDVEAAAGFGAQNADYFDTSKAMRLPASMLPNMKGERLCIAVVGESMAPTLPDGSRVVIRRLPHAEYPQIPNNHICVVTDRDGETFIKRIKNRLKTAGVLTLISDNPNRRKYRPFDIDETEIHNVWVAELFITDAGVNCADYVSTDNEVAGLHEAVAELRAEVSKIAARVERSGK